MSNGIFGKDNRVDDKTKQNQVPGMMTQRNATAAAAPAPAPVPTLPQPAAAPASPAEALTGSTLTVGPNIKLKSAEITDCDTLVVEGHVDGMVSSQAIVIAETGTLNGTATIDNAEIRGEFKGELTVKKRLMICATGKVSGKIAYGKLVIEEGGELVGEIQAMHGSIPVLGSNSNLESIPMRSSATGTGSPALNLPSRH